MNDCIDIIEFLSTFGQDQFLGADNSWHVPDGCLWARRVSVASRYVVQPIKAHREGNTFHIACPNPIQLWHSSSLVLYQHFLAYRCSYDNVRQAPKHVYTEVIYILSLRPCLYLWTLILTALHGVLSHCCRNQVLSSLPVKMRSLCTASIWRRYISSLTLTSTFAF